MRDDRMTVQELANTLGKSPMWVVDELRRDSKRDIARWPFATSTKSDTGRWSYVLIRSHFQRWHAGDSPMIDYDRLADLVADRVVAKLQLSKGA